MKLDKFKQRQIDYYCRKWQNYQRSPKEKTPVVKYFSNFALDKVTKIYPINFKDKNVLISCGGGDGFEIVKMESLGGRITVSDISPDAIKEIKKRWPKMKTIIADAERLPFKDNSFQIGLVKDGLHHLVKPEEGIKELLRVCSEGVMIIDFNESFLTRFASNIGLSPKFEEAGNHNFRFSREKLKKFLNKIKVKNYRIKACFVHAPLFQHSFLQKGIGFKLMKISAETLNLFLGSFGNVLLIVIIKDVE